MINSLLAGEVSLLGEFPARMKYRRFCMNNLEQFYASVGGNAQEVLGRLGGDPGLVIHFLLKFQNDGSYQSLCDALNADDTPTAFRAAHTLKGLCATLG